MKKITNGTPKKNEYDSQNEPKKWNPNAICTDEKSGSNSAADDAAWLLKNKEYSLESAQERVMEEFPDEF